MTVYHLTKQQAGLILKILGQETTPILDTPTSASVRGATDPMPPPNEPVIIIVD